MITNPSPSCGSLPSRLNCPMPAKYIGCLSPVDVVGLFLLRIIRVLHPLVPAIRRDNAPAVCPYRLEEFAGGHGLAPGIDRWRSLALGPEWLPSPGHQIPAQAAGVLVQDAHL